MAYDLEFLDDPAAFLGAAGEHLAADPVVSTVVATFAERTVRERAAGVPPVPGIPHWWLVAREAGRVVGAAMRNAPFAPHPPYLLPMPEGAAVALGETLHARGEELGGINGALPAARVCAEAYAAPSGRPVTVAEHTRLFELGELVAPPVPDGVLRRAGEADLELALAWYGAFEADAAEQGGRPAPEQPRHDLVERDGMLRRIAAGRVWLWEDARGEVVHLTGANPPSFGVARIGPVYTPREWRGHGYASAAVAAVAAGLRAEGARVTLFTDQANPTSNHIYTQLGFRPVADQANLQIG